MLFIQSYYGKGATHCHCVMTETQRRTEEWESFMVEKGEDPCGP